MENIAIEKLKKMDIREASLVLAVSFQENPNTRAIWADPASPRAIESFAQMAESAKLGRKFNQVLVAKAQGKVVGVINFVNWPQCQPSLLEKLSMMPKLVFSFGRAMPRAMTVMSAWGKLDPKKPHCHIGPLGVLPEFKGQGIGSKLLEACLKISDEKRIPCYLETDAPRNLNLYQRHGFKIIKEVPIYNYPTWLMWRDVKEWEK